MKYRACAAARKDDRRKLFQQVAPVRCHDNNQRRSNGAVVVVAWGRLHIRVRSRLYWGRGSCGQCAHPIRHGGVEAPHEAVADLQPERIRLLWLHIPRDSLRAEDQPHLRDGNVWLLALHDATQRKSSLGLTQRLCGQPVDRYHRAIFESRSPSSQ